MIRNAIGIGLIILIPLTVLYWFFIGFTGNGCTGTTVTEIASPTGAWKASVVDWLCESAWVTHITSEVQLVSARDATKSADILGVGTGGLDDERPRTYLKVGTLEYDGIRIDLRYDLNDVGSRAR
jgi:hypothetical protein